MVTLIPQLKEDIKTYYELYDSIVDNICNRIIKGKYFEGYSDEIIKEKENVIVRMMYNDVKERTK